MVFSSFPLGSQVIEELSLDGYWSCCCLSLREYGSSNQS